MRQYCYYISDCISTVSYCRGTVVLNVALHVHVLYGSFCFLTVWCYVSNCKDTMFLTVGVLCFFTIGVHCFLTVWYMYYVSDCMVLCF